MSKIVNGKNDLDYYCRTYGKEYLLEEWDKAKNGSLTPLDVTYGSVKKAWWICPKGHSYEAIISNRTRKGNCCPICANQVVLPGYNDLETFCRANAKEHLLAEWDDAKNAPSTPQNTYYGTLTKRWWICPAGHSYESVVNNRTAKGFQCPYCSSQKLLSGYNDLQTRRPDIAKYWDYTKNAGLTPSDVMAFSNKYVFWKCSDCGNEWRAAICSTKSCPRCSDDYKVSESEKVIYYYLSMYFPDAELTFHAPWLGRREIDVYIPSIKVAVEYDGEYWHRKIQTRDLQKSELIKNHGDLLIRIREEKLDTISDDSIQITVPSKKYTFDRLDEPVREVFSIIGKERNIYLSPDIDVLRDWKEILSKAQADKKEKSLAAKFPDLAKTWNYEKNQGLRPESFLPGSNKKVWWKCPDCGYEWEEIIANRTKRRTPCSKCFNENTRRLIPGVTDLTFKYPEIAAEWDFRKNGDVRPNQVTYGSTQKVWWICAKCGNNWQATIANRTTGFGCPICGRKKAANSLRNHLLRKGENDLLTVNPELARQWDYERNALTPDEISAYSSKKVWWKCDACSSRWEASVSSRIKTTNCPFCINRRFRSGLNDIVTVAPNLAKEWDYDKNGIIDPTQIICTSQKKVWWICSDCGNSWKASIRSRWSGSGCPACRSQQRMATRTANMLKNGNTLESLYPEIASEWHPTKNGDLRPNMVTARNGRKVWWLGKCGHEWQATVKHRTNGTGCPYCADVERGLERRQKVINLDTGEIFDSAISAAEKYHVSYSSIRICVLGKTKRAGKPKCRWAAYKE